MDGYSLAVSLAFPLIRSRLRKKYGDGYVTARLQPVSPVGPVDFLVHAASVGEQNLVAPVVQRLVQAGQTVLLTAATPTGLAQARALAKGLDGVNVSYLPFDLASSVSPFLEAVQPGCVVLVETELWPNLIRRARQMGSRVVLINGRISDDAFPNYRRFRFVFRHTLASLDACLVRYREDGRRFAALGVPSERIQVTGNLKLAMRADAKPAEIRTDRPVVVFGSTRDNEESIILESVAARIRTGELVPVFAPRHPERADEVGSLLQAAGIPVTATKGQRDFEPAPGSAILVNETGRLLSFYGRADLCFVGGSLVDRGGQNFVEPFLFGKPVITGPYLDNFRDLLPLFADALTIVHSGGELARAVDAYLTAPDGFRMLGEKGHVQVKAQGQALDRVMAVLL